MSQTQSRQVNFYFSNYWGPGTWSSWAIDRTRLGISQWSYLKLANGLPAFTTHEGTGQSNLWRIIRGTYNSIYDSNGDNWIDGQSQSCGNSNYGRNIQISTREGDLPMARTASHEIGHVRGDAHTGEGDTLQISGSQTSGFQPYYTGTRPGTRSLMGNSCFGSANTAFPFYDDVASAMWRNNEYGHVITPDHGFESWRYWIVQPPNFPGPFWRGTFSRIENSAAAAGGSFYVSLPPGATIETRTVVSGIDGTTPLTASAKYRSYGTGPITFEAWSQAVTYPTTNGCGFSGPYHYNLNNWSSIGGIHRELLVTRSGNGSSAWQSLTHVDNGVPAAQGRIIQYKITNHSNSTFYLDNLTLKLG